MLHLDYGTYKAGVKWPTEGCHVGCQTFVGFENLG